jgi:hypothetical protein
MNEQETLETWEMKAKRLAQELKKALPEPFSATKKQRETYQRIRYQLNEHIKDVPDE